MSQRMTKQSWDNFTADITSKKFYLTIRELDELIQINGQKPLSYKMKECLFESFKVKKNIEDNPEDLNERLVNARDLISARLMKKTKRIDDLIAIQREQDNQRDDYML
jgi:hypothetical protein